MRPFHLVLIVLPLLAACATTPRGQCEAPHRAELRTVNAEADDTALSLERGFRLVPARFDRGINFCVTRTGHVRRCRAEDGEPMFDKRPINRAAETAKLTTLRAERARLDAAIMQCRETYPE